MQSKVTTAVGWCLSFALLQLAPSGRAMAQSAEGLGDELVLVHRLSMPSRAGWHAMSVPMVAGSWRVGTVKGPPATDEQLRAVLTELDHLHVGMRCTRWVEGPTHYPCGVSVRDVEVAGAVRMPFTLVAMTDPTTTPGDTPSSVAGQTSAVAPTLRRDAGRQVMLRLPLTAPPGGESLRIGDIVRFELQTISNPNVQARFERDSAVLVLKAPLRGTRMLSPTEVYRGYVDAFSRGRIDEALSYFARTAVVVAGPACTAWSPCVGRQEIRERYLSVLITRRIPAPLIDQRYDGVRMTTRGEQIPLVGPDGATVRVVGGHTFEFADGRITSLTFALDTTDPATLAFVARAASAPQVSKLKAR